MLELVTGAFVAVAAVGLVLEPLLRGVSPVASVAPPAGDPDLDLVDIRESASPKVRALLALKEIEFDRATGKLSDDDYASLKQQYAQHAIAAMDGDDGDVDPAAEDAAERAVARIKSRGTTSCATCGVRPEPGAVFCSRCGRALAREDARARCWMCGAGLATDAKFCGGCGFALSA